MKLFAILETILLGPREAREQRAVASTLQTARADLTSQQSAVRAMIQQNKQASSNNASQIMQTMTNAMIMMESGNGNAKK